jgi:hypothetical protein
MTSNQAAETYLSLITAPELRATVRYPNTSPGLQLADHRSTNNINLEVHHTHTFAYISYTRLQTLYCNTKYDMAPTHHEHRHNRYVHFPCAYAPDDSQHLCMYTHTNASSAVLPYLEAATHIAHPAAQALGGILSSSCSPLCRALHAQSQHTPQHHLNAQRHLVVAPWPLTLMQSVHIMHSCSTPHSANAACSAACGSCLSCC